MSLAQVGRSDSPSTPIRGRFRAGVLKGATELLKGAHPISCFPPPQSGRNPLRPSRPAHWPLRPSRHVSSSSCAPCARPFVAAAGREDSPKRLVGCLKHRGRSLEGEWSGERMQCNAVWIRPHIDSYGFSWSPQLIGKYTSPMGLAGWINILIGVLSEKSPLHGPQNKWPRNRRLPWDLSLPLWFYSLSFWGKNKISTTSSNKSVILLYHRPKALETYGARQRQGVPPELSWCCLLILYSLDFFGWLL